MIVPPPANDTCGGAEYHIVEAGDSFSFPGTFAGALDDYQTFCADDDPQYSFRDVVYELDVQEPCTLEVTVAGAGIAPAVSMRSACETDEFCSYVPGDEFETVLSSVNAGTYYFVVSNLLDSGDAFDVSVTCEPPVCGDALLASTEECDDGNAVDGDGCDSSCKLEVADPLTDTCSGASGVAGISIAAGEIKHVPSSAAEIRSTINASDSGTGSCMLVPDSADPDFPTYPSNDHVYRVTPSASGTLTVKLGYDNNGVLYCGADESVEPSYPYPVGCYDRSLHVREGACEDIGAEIACAESQVSWWAPEVLSFSVTAGSDYYVFVDGWLNFGPGEESVDVGEYVLDIDLQ